MPKHKREWPMDDNWVTGFELKGPQVWVQFDLLGGAEPLVIDQVDGPRARGERPGRRPGELDVLGARFRRRAGVDDLGHDSGMSTFGGDISPT